MAKIKEIVGSDPLNPSSVMEKANEIIREVNRLTIAVDKLISKKWREK